MYTLIMTVHIVVSLVLILVILLQSGRGGMAEAMGGASAQSLFGGGVSNVLTRATGVCAVVFVMTCLSLAYLSTARGRSIVEQVPMTLPEQLPSALVPKKPAPIAHPSSTPSALPAPAASATATVPSTPTPAWHARRRGFLLRDTGKTKPKRVTFRLIPG